MEVTVETLLEKDLKGRVIVFETDTVYGLGCLIGDELAIEKMYAIKKREKKKPFAVLVAKAEDAYTLIKYPKRLRPYASYYWPGAMTFVSEKSDRVSDITSRGLDTVGVRLPDNDTAYRILNHFGAMVVTSLNVANKPPVVRYEAALAFEDKVDYIVKGGNTSGGVSTVFDIDNNRILRSGRLEVKRNRL